MNKSRRKYIEQVIACIESARNCIEKCKMEEETAYDNLPESLQCSDSGCRMQDAIDSLEDAISQSEELIDTLAQAIE